MPKRSRKPKSDPNRSAFDLLRKVVEKAETEGKDPLAVALGRRGGLKGGHARAAKMTAQQRSASAKLAAKARWSKAKAAD